MTIDRYAAAESFYKLAMAYAPVPDLHIMWLLHLCDAHQEMQSWAEAAQCAVAVAGVIMQVSVLDSYALLNCFCVTYVSCLSRCLYHSYQVDFLYRHLWEGMMLFGVGIM